MYMCEYLALTFQMTSFKKTTINQVTIQVRQFIVLISLQLLIQYFY